MPATLGEFVVRTAYGAELVVVASAEESARIQRDLSRAITPAVTALRRLQRNAEASLLTRQVD
jgi:hypothetical protein